MTEVSDFLEHYGVKGMRWGVRKSRNRVSTGKTNYRKAPNRLSNEELDRRIKRLEKEQKYKELTAVPKSEGRKYVQSLLEGSGKTAVGALVGGTATFFVQRALKKRFG